jgi:hypothetical protein
MDSRSLLAFGLTTALGGVPSFASAARSAVGEASALDGGVAPIVAGAVAISVAGIVLLVRRRQSAAPDAPGTPAERSIKDAGDEAITAALRARTLRRGRMRLDDDAGNAGRRSTPPREMG